MEDDAWVADYFTTVGSNGDLELLDPDLHSPELLECMWEDAITDITLVRTGNGEQCPEGYELIERTPMDYSANINHGSLACRGVQRAVHLAIRRQHVSKRDDYIAEIQVVCGNAHKFPGDQGWELLERTFSGKRRRDGHPVGDEKLLAVRRAVRNLVDCPSAVCSVCVLLRNKEEHPPPGYRVIREDLNRSKFGDVVHLAYQLGGALSTCHLPFRSMILDRYPDKDSAMFPFPGDQLPMFVYPKGMLLEQRSGRDTPKSSFFSFVFTNIDGRRTYTACLTFYEPMQPSAARRLTRKLFTCRQESSRDIYTVAPEQATQGRMRMTLHGSLSVGALSSLSQQSGRRSRSGTGTWSGLGRVDPAAWPRALARGGTDPVTAPMVHTSWTKMSAATRATRDTSQSQAAQPMAADGLSVTAATNASNASHSLQEQLSPMRAAYASRSVDGRRWRSDVPFRENTNSDGRERNEMEVQAAALVLPPRAAGPGQGDGRERIATTSSASARDTSTVSAQEWNTGDNNELNDAEYDLMCQNEDRPCIFAPKTICVISRFPIYGVLRRFLRHLYAISLSMSRVPLERYISMFVSSVPMPPPGGCPFHVYLEPLENRDPRRSRLKPLSLQRPPEAWLPLMDIDFTAPFRCLSVQSVLTVFALMLQEAKILFLSSRAELLTQVMEALRSLLFPMEWQSVYVPQLPYALAGYLECPGGFMIGMRLTKGELERGTGGTAAIVRDLGLDGVANAVNLDAGEVLLYSGHLADCVANGSADDIAGAASDDQTGQGQSKSQTCCQRDGTVTAGVNRKTGCSDIWVGTCTCQGTRSKSSKSSKSLRKILRLMISRKRRNRNRLGVEEERPSSLNNRDGDEETATPWLPRQLLGGLASRLTRELFGKGGLRVGVEEDLDQYESAFEFAPAPDRSGGDSPGGTDGTASASPVDVGTASASLLVRDCFLVCMAELLAGICGSVRRPKDDPSRQSLRMKPPEELFNMAEFLEGMDESAAPFLQRLTSTQMFWVTLHKWVSTTDKQLLFFEECAVAIKNRRAGAVVPCRERERDCKNRERERDDKGKDTQDIGSSGNQENFIPLVDEVLLKRPDLCEVHPPHLYGSVQFDGARSTPLATPRSTSRSRSTSTPWLHRGAGAGTWEGYHDKSTCGLTAWDLNEDLTADPAIREGPSLITHEGEKTCTPENASRTKGTGDWKPYGDVDQNVWSGVGIKTQKREEIRPYSASPIIIPGPTVEGLPEDGRSPCYRYDNGWPTPLDRNLLHTPPDALPPIVLQLQHHANCQPNKSFESTRHGTNADASQAVMMPAFCEHPSENSYLQARSLSNRLESLLPGDDDRPKKGYRGDKRLWRPHGRGKMIYRDSKIYNGEWRQGRQHGQGSMHYAIGNQYMGEWKLGKKSGSGTMTYPDGSRYGGSWFNDQRHGQGKYWYASGAVYDGGWEHGKMHGMGCYTSASSSRFEGIFKHGRRCGQGTMTYSGGQIYTGEWADGLRDGHGTYTVPDGTIYEGYYRRDRRHGPGKLYRSDGNVTRQLWEDGKLMVNPEDGNLDLPPSRSGERKI